MCNLAAMKIISSNFHSNLLRIAVFENDDRFKNSYPFLGTGIEYVFFIKDEKIEAVSRTKMAYN
jgi:hypothetical protein